MSIKKSLQSSMVLVACVPIMIFTVIAISIAFHNSNKTESGALESKAGWKGLCRKCVTLLFVLVAHRLDISLGVDYIRTTIIIGFIVNESLSIIENAGLMGVPIPNILKKAVEILREKSEKGGE